MTKMAIEIDIKNENELLRVCENNLKNAKSDTEKTKLNNSISKIKAEISRLEAEEKAM
ncbi:hypothetical protein [uncultured Clostridium sp.]|uniref:hypothetical protein n=1 Tax=uncultured Clostridium sp. TaxID=59620 RepID=UPI0025E1773A|nr:hypothetical protein [uncultured Clostridium sp.]